MPKYSVVIPHKEDQLETIRERTAWFPEYVQPIYVLGDSERIVARNAGMQVAKGEWVCWLDADDAYLPFYFSELDYWIGVYPEAKVFNFGSLVIHQDHNMSIRPTFKPQELGKDSFVGAEFKSGRISTGAFIFKREVVDNIGYLPHATTPYGGDKSFSAVSNNPNYQPVNGQWPPMGNPFGDDYEYFYMITRKYDSQPLDVILYQHNVRK